MKLETNGKVIFDITRAKAKQYEFGIDESFHLELSQDPKKLIVFTIGVLGELTALEARPNDDRQSYKEELKDQLILVSQYFEALSTSRLTPEIDEYLRILSSASYYLADMPGSSLVLARSIAATPSRLTDSYLEAFLVWILKCDTTDSYYEFQDGAYNEEMHGAFTAYVEFFERNGNASDVDEATRALREEVYNTGTDRELLLVDTIAALIRRKTQNSSLVCLPLYTGMSLEIWNDTLNNEGFIKEFWPGQRLVGELGVLKGRSAVMQMPTSAGKTKSAELIIRSAFLSGRAKLAVIVAPFRALCREISVGFEKSFENDSVNVNELRDITNIDGEEQEFLKFLLGDAYRGGHDYTIMISTPEKLVYLLRYEPELAEKIGLLIFDEGHQFDSGKRGVTYELLIASLKSAISPETQKVLISAVMANAETIGQWLNGERSVNIQGSNNLPSIRSVAFLSWVTEMGQLSYLSQDNKKDSGLYVPRIVQQVNLGVKGKEKIDRLFPDKEKPQSISCYLGLRLCFQGPVALFCGDKRSLVSISKLLIDYYSRGLAIPKPIEAADKTEILKIANLSDLHFSKVHPFSKAIRMGVLPHSSGVPNGIRTAVEWAMENRKANFVVCTSTLAQGVNLPIKYLIVSSTMQGQNRIKTRDFQNLIGRAGRSGYHTEGGIIFSNPSLYDDRSTHSGRYKWAAALALLDFNNSEACLSSLKDIINPFKFEQAEDDLHTFLKNPSRRRKQWVRWGIANNINVADLMNEMDSKEQVLVAIESYFLSVLKDDPEALDESVFNNLTQQTLAFFLADDSEREDLLAIFKIIHGRLSEIPVEKYSYYGKTLLGIDHLQYIEDWIDTNLFELELAESPKDLLSVCWDLISDFSTSEIIAKIQPSSLSAELANLWIKGESFNKMFEYAKAAGGKFKAKSQLRNINQDHIVEHCSALSYDGMLIIGSMADIIEGKSINEDLLSLVRTLQNQLKLGLANDFDIWLYSQGYADREVCKHISKEFNSIVPNKNIIDYGILRNNPEHLSRALDALPSIYSNVRVR